MGRVGRILGFGLHHSMGGELPRVTFKQTTTASDLGVFECRMEDCPGIARIPAPFAVCSGRVDQRHSSRNMRQVEDTGQESTDGLIVNGRVQNVSR